jgi:hypothetical protein
MANTAASDGGPSHTLGRLYQIHGGIRHPGSGWHFPVRSCMIVADKTVNVVGVGKVKAFIFPSITDVTAGAAGPVSWQRDAEVIDQILFSQSRGDPFLVGKFVAQPVPVSGFHDVLVNAVMAEEAGFGNLLRSGERAFNKLRMVLLRPYGDAGPKYKKQCCRGFHIVQF